MRWLKLTACTSFEWPSFETGSLPFSLPFFNRQTPFLSFPYYEGQIALRCCGRSSTTPPSRPPAPPQTAAASPDGYICLPHPGRSMGAPQWDRYQGYPLQTERRLAKVAKVKEGRSGERRLESCREWEEVNAIWARTTPTRL